MKRRQLTPAEEKRLADAFVAQALAMGLKANKKLPRDVKRRVRARVLIAIESDRKAQAIREARRQEFEAGKNTFTWQPQRRRQA